ncbi:MAG: hypothetical protein K2O35_05715 [Clostridia bacterium]|nr:hypothetical protein [Clostridia bacterium]
MMKKKVLVYLIIILIILMAVFFVSCIGSLAKEEPLKDYDFSMDNIVEVRISSSPMFINLHGTIYGVKKGDSQEGDEAISAIAEAWSVLQKDATFSKAKKYDAITTGGTYYYECIFADGNSIKIDRDRVDNLYFNEGSSLRIDYDYQLDDFHSIYAEIMQKEYIVGHISVNHYDNCDCDEPPNIA